MKKILLLSVSVVGLIGLGVSLAGGSTISSAGVSSPSAISSSVTSDYYMPPYPGNEGATYIIDATGAKLMLAQKSSLYQVNCDSGTLLKALGFTKKGLKIFSLGIQEDTFEYTFDMKNCTLYGNLIDNTYNYTKSLTEKQALAFADTYIKKTFFKDKIFLQIGAPIIVYRNNNSIVYPMMKGGVGMGVSSIRAEDSALPGIVVDDSDPENVDQEYTSFSIMYPYVINGLEVWEQYGTRAGITLEVSADGVVSINARLLPFKAATKTSDKLTGDDLLRIVANGGNSPFRGTTKTVNFAKPLRVMVLFNVWKNNKNYIYLSSGIGFKSEVKTDAYAVLPYTMILSDYKIGNTAQ